MRNSKAKMLRKIAEILKEQYPDKDERILYKALKKDYKAGRMKV